MYEAYYSPLTGQFAARRISDLAIISKNGAGWSTFLAWNAAQPEPLDVSDHEPPGPTQEQLNETTIRDVLLGEIDAMLTKADALQTILDQWEQPGGTPNNAAVLAHVKRVTRDLIRLARDVVRLVRLELRKLDAV